LEIGLSRNSVWLTFDVGTQYRFESLNVFVCPPQFEPTSVKGRGHQGVALDRAGQGTETEDRKGTRNPDPDARRVLP
jgi:hypothetical protein